MSSITAPEPATVPPQRKLLAWLPTLLWLCVLAVFSTDLFSAEHTGSILEKIIRALFGPISFATFQQIHFLIRKAAHFCSYGFLSALAFFSWRATFPLPQNAQQQRVPGAPVRELRLPAVLGRGPWRFRWALLGVLTALLAGSLDEIHQSFVPSRGSSFHDVLLDTAGALFFQLVIALVIARRESARKPEPGL